MPSSDMAKVSNGQEEPPKGQSEGPQIKNCSQTAEQEPNPKVFPVPLEGALLFICQAVFQNCPSPCHHYLLTV